MAFDKIFADFAIEPGSVTAQLMGADSIETAAIKDGQVVEAKLGALAVTTAKIADLAVTAGKLAADSVETAKILDLAVTTAKIDNLAVTTGKIADAAVTNDKILDGTINISKVDSGFKAAVLNAFYRVIQVQSGAVALAGSDTSLVLGTDATEPMEAVPAATADGVIGALAYGSAKNKVFLRTHSNDPILDNGVEIFGRMSFAAGDYTVDLKKIDANGDEVAATVPADYAGTEVHVVYRRRYTADAVPEEFGSGEIFATGVQDVTEASNIAQLAKDLGVSLAGTGAMSLSKSLVQKLGDHVAGSADQHAAEHITFSSLVAGLTGSADVKAALEAIQGSLAAHVSLATDAHDASAISIEAALQTALGAASADVAAALAALNSRVGGGSSDLQNHLNDTEGAHAASAIAFSNTASGMVATTAQGAIDELDTRVDSLENAMANVQAKDWVMNPVITATAGQTVFALDAGISKLLPLNLAAIIVTIDGVEQFNFTRNADGKGVTFDAGVSASRKVRIRFYA